MSLAYLPDYAEQATQALELAKKEAAHLGYTHRTLYAHAIDIEWVKGLEQNQELAEKIDAFVGARKFRTLLLHEYLSDPQLFLESLQAADGATQMLDKIVKNIEHQAGLLGLGQASCD